MIFYKYSGGLQAVGDVDGEDDVVEQQLHTILERQQGRIDEAGIHDLREHLVAFRRRAESVRRVPLSLADEPALRFDPQE